MSKKAFTQVSLPFVRDNLASFLKVYNRRTGRELGYIGNISRNGLMLITRWRVQTDTVFHLRIVLPDDLQTNCYVDFDARCQWCRPDIDAESFDSGYTVIASSVNYDTLIDSLRGYFSFR
ncbi:PilZ domain-containing protein [Parendozoicomonas haliclonae]|uniref:PilZ domain-containing protein n=1 Tax=Parendozoicomonas haliclonae TaxID=1960125 RepID=A0A1X7AHX5_9GAMM|nr:PilZ domain-containing protein [Parendozoicomonas haliclonae]SMA42471.1 hypothetical protein EHSB41UT_01435 [Parendozoicomonas haliclonae]